MARDEPVYRLRSDEEATLITAKEARRLLGGISRLRLFGLDIPRVLLPGPAKRFKYRRADVLAFRERQKTTESA